MINSIFSWRTYLIGTLPRLVTVLCSVPVGGVRWWGLLIVVDSAVLSLHIVGREPRTVRRYPVRYSVLVDCHGVKHRLNDVIGARGCLNSLENASTANYICSRYGQHWVVDINEFTSGKRRLFPYLGVVVLLVALMTSFHSLVGVVLYFR